MVSDIVNISADSQIKFWAKIGKKYGFVTAVEYI